MINEIRTLLGNRQMDPLSMGYQYIDPSYTEFPFSSSAQNFLRLLYLRPDFDDATINFLLAQYMSLVHQPDLKLLLPGFDQRITYDPFSTFWFDQVSIFPVVSYVYGPPAQYSTLYITADRQSLDPNLQDPILQKYTLEYLSPTQTKIWSKGQSRVQNVSFDASGTSNWIDLDPGFLRCRFFSSTGALQSYFSITVSDLNHIQLSLPEIFKNIYQTQLPALTEWSTSLGMQPALGWVNGGFSVLDRLGAALIILAAQLKNEHNIL